MTLVNLPHPAQVAQLLRAAAFTSYDPGTPPWVAALNAADEITAAITDDDPDEPLPRNHAGRWL